MIAATTLEAEQATYGEVTLNGLARESWPAEPFGMVNATVCNLAGREDVVGVHLDADAGSPVVQSFGRLAVLTVNSKERRGPWVHVLGAHRARDLDGESLPRVDVFMVKGWVRDGYLCDTLR